MKQALKDKDREKYLRRTREVTTVWPHYSSPSPTQHHIKRDPLSLQFLRWEKEDPSGHSSAIELWDASQEAHAGLTLWESLGEFPGSITGNQIEMKKWAELTVTSTQVLVGCISACHRIQVESPASGSVLQNRAGGQRAQLEILPYLDFQPTSHTRHGAGLWPCLSREANSQVCLTSGYSFHFHPIRNPAQTTQAATVPICGQEVKPEVLLYF